MGLIMLRDPHWQGWLEDNKTIIPPSFERETWPVQVISWRLLTR
mgnify:FL=1